MEKNMKSLVRLGAILGIVGSTLLGPSPIGKMSALALPEASKFWKNCARCRYLRLQTLRVRP